MTMSAGVKRRALFAGAAALAAPAVARAQSHPVKIGVLGDYGSGRDLGGPGSVAAAQLAAEDAARLWGMKEVEILAGDHGNKPDVATNLARRWIDQDGVEAITDLAVSSVALAVAGLCAQKQRAALVSGAAISDLTGSQCSPYITHWADDTYALSAGSSRALVHAGQRKWFFIAVDYAFGQTMLREAGAAIAQAGGTVVGSVRFPFNTTDFASQLLAAQSSGADTVAFASSGNDTVNAIKQAVEFGLRKSGQTLVGMLTFISDVHSIGLQSAQGMVTTSQYYWDDDEPSRAFARRFTEKQGRVPTKLQAATYVAVLHYLKAVQQSGSRDSAEVGKALRAMKIDFFGRESHIRPDGRLIYDLSLYRVKSPAESKGPWDYYHRIEIIPGNEAFRPLAEGGCRFVQG